MSNDHSFVDYMMMEVLVSRHNSCRFFRTLNRALLAKYIELKNEFERFTPPNHEILSTFKVNHSPPRPGDCDLLQSLRRSSPVSRTNWGYRVNSRKRK
jgi:hypothetical protein